MAPTRRLVIQAWIVHDGRTEAKGDWKVDWMGGLEGDWKVIEAKGRIEAKGDWKVIER